MHEQTLGKREVLQLLPVCVDLLGKTAIGIRKGVTEGQNPGRTRWVVLPGQFPPEIYQVKISFFVLNILYAY